MTRLWTMRRMAVIIVGMLWSGPATWAQETEIPIDQVPKAVLSSARDKFPGLKVKEASKETEDGATVFELNFTHEGRKIDATFKEDGTLVLTETVVPEKDLPEAVLQAAKTRFPGSTVRLAESVKKGPKVKKEVDYYELHLKTADGKAAEVEVDSSGKILKTEGPKQSKEKDEDEKDEKEDK
jgi:uncharacterized membrane protein YkoI